MAAKWVKSMQCKSRAFDDVFSPQPLLPSSSCRNSFHGLKDVLLAPPKPKPKPNPNSKPNPKPKPKPDEPRPRLAKPVSVSVPHRLFLSLSDLPEGHPSRNVVEIIFHTRWAHKSAFPGRVEMVLKVHNSGKTLARFEEYRDAVKSRAGSEPTNDGGSDEERLIRCVADGNEMMRFYCLGPTSPGAIDDSGGIWEVDGGGKGPACACRIGTFSGSGAAHASACGGKGRRAMLVCRVIAGRVGKQANGGPVRGFDSVGGPNGVLLVFDARAVLPCFLVIYKL